MWGELETFHLQEWIHASNAELPAARTLVDSGDGNHVNSVYEYV